MVLLKSLPKQVMVMDGAKVIANFAFDRLEQSVEGDTRDALKNIISKVLDDKICGGAPCVLVTFLEQSEFSSLDKEKKNVPAKKEKNVKETNDAECKKDAGEGKDVGPAPESESSDGDI